MKNMLSFALALCLVAIISNSAKAQNRYELDIFTAPQFRNENGNFHADTFYLEFRFYENKGMSTERRISRHPVGAHIDFVLQERIGSNRVPEPLYVPGSIEYIETGEGIRSDDITISLVVDRSGSITVAEMRQIRDAVEAFVNELPDGSVFLSYFHNQISPSYQLTRANFEAMADTLLTRTPFHTDLYNVTVTKLLEFDSTAVIPNQRLDEQFGYRRSNVLAQRGTRNNYLIVMTDGENDIGAGSQFPNPKYLQMGQGTIIMSENDVIEKIHEYRERVTVFTIGFGAESANFNPRVLQSMVNASGNPNGYIYVEPDSILALFQTELVETLGPDYRARFYNPPGKIFSGEQRTFRITFLDTEKGIEAPSGFLTYGFGSITNPYIVDGQAEASQTMLWGALAGIIFIFVILVIIQFIVPLINNKVFNAKYVLRYRPVKGEIKKACPYCNDPIFENQPVMAKCKHIVHTQCWVANDYMCPEYGQNCNTGKQFYFDINDPFSRKNKLPYLSWVFFGLVGGFLAWLSFLFIRDIPFTENLAISLVDSLTASDDVMRFNYIQKITPLLAIGFSMGFFLSLFFAYVEEYRRINVLILMQFLLRGITGAFIGLISFLAGGILIVSLGVAYTNIYYDWIPWLIFGAFIGLSLSVKSTIDWIHGLLGGVIAIVFSFIVLYAFSAQLGDLGYLILVISFMLYGAGLGGSIATVRTSAEQYFLRILNGPREGLSIAVHKWMRSGSGVSEVYIGTSGACEINMNWGNTEEVAEKHAKMYMNRDRKIPVLVSLEKGKSTILNQRVEMNTGKEYELLNGTSFTIGNTVFNYYEADRN